MGENNMPTHIAIIMDGNRRWAKKKGLPIKLGHRQGAETLKADNQILANILLNKATEEYPQTVGKFLTNFDFQNFIKISAPPSFYRFTGQRSVSA